MGPPPRTTDAPSPYEAELARLAGSAAEGDAAVAWNLARQAQQAGEPAWAVRLLLQAARLWGLSAHESRALGCLQRAVTLARRHDLDADLARAELEWGRQLSFAAQHHRAMRVLVGLLRSPRLVAHLSPSHKSNALLLLASLAADVDSAAELRCVQAAIQACARGPSAAMRSCVASEAQAWLRRWLFTSATFDCRLPPEQLPDPERAQCLEQARACAERLPALTDPASRMQSMLTRVTTALVDAAVQRRASLLFAAVRELTDDSVTPRGYAYAMLGMAMAVALELDDLDVSARLLAQLEPLDGACSHMVDLRVFRLLLEAVLARRRGDELLFARLYPRYATAWADWSRSMDLRPAELLQSVDAALRHETAGPATEADWPDWLRRAHQLVREAGLQPLSVEQLASRVGVPVRTLREAFRRYLGVHPRKALEEARLDALHALVGGGAMKDKTLAELAAMAGYSHPSRLSRAYVARFGIALSTRRAGARPPAPRRAAGARPAHALRV